MRVNRVTSILDESVGDKGLQYELQVYHAIMSSKIPGLSPGDKPAAGYSNQGAGDIEATYNGNPFNIEIKLDRKAQMGGGQLIYDRSSSVINPHPNMLAKTDPDDIGMILDAAKSKMHAIDNYIDELTVRGVEAYGFPASVPKEVRDQMTADGFSKPVNTVVTGSTRYIVDHYNKKGVYYIQIGGAGLFYLGKNPLGLPVPPFEGDARIELRIKYAGATPNSQGVKSSNRRAEWVAIGRLMTSVKSSYSLDNPKSIQEMFSEQGPKGK
jgi:hypothetical protein